MTDFAILKNPVKQVVALLVSKQYDELVHLTRGQRMSKDMIERAVSEYGRDLTSLPEVAFDRLDVVEVRDAVPPRWSVRCELWGLQEGLSDLSLELTIAEAEQGFDIELDDIRVL